MEKTVTALQNEIEKLNKQLELFKAFADYSSDFEMFISPEGNFIYISPSCKNLTGYSAEEFIENPGLFSQIVCNEIDISVINNQVKRNILSDISDKTEFRILTKEGNIRWVEQNCSSAFDKNGNIIGYRVSLREITNRKNFETELNQTNKILNDERKLFSHGNIAVFKWKNQANWPVDYASENVSNILGYTPDEIKSSQYPYSGLIHPDDIERVVGEVEFNSISKNDKFEHKPYRLICKDGSIIWVSDYTIIQRNDNYEIEYYLGYIVDITKRIIAEQALKTSKAQIAAILHAMPDMMFIFNNEGVCSDYYAAQPEKLYAKPEEFVGKNMSVFLPHEMVNELKIIFELTIQTKKVQIYEYSLPTQENIIEHFEARIVAYEDDKIISIIRNITERKKSEIAVKESEERYKRIANTISDYLYTVKIKNGIVVETIHNEACQAITGYTPNEFNENKYLWINMVVPEDRDMVRERFNKVKESEVLQPIEHRIICKNGQIRWISDTVIPKYDTDGVLISYDGIITDITKRKTAELALKESEEKFRMIVMNNPDLTIYQDETGKTIYINEQAAKVLGHSAETFLGANFPEFILAEDYERVSNILEQIKYGKSIENYEYRFYAKNGEINFLSHNAKPIIVNNKFLGIVSSIRNITEQKKFEEALKESELWYKSLNEAKDKFFSIIAHDLTGPYSNVLRLLDLLQSNIYKYPLNKIEQFVNNIYLSTKNAFLLLQSLLLWAKSQRGLLPFNPETINIKNLFNFKIDFFKEIANQKKIEIYNKLENDIIISADVNMLKTILQNFISNSIKYTNPGGKIYLSAEEVNVYVEICIADTGIGMDEEIMGKLFKLDSSLTTIGTADEQGTGLGLIICKELVEKHNGKVTVESSPGVGSVFKFTIPKI